MFVLKGSINTIDGLRIEQNEYELRGIYYDYIENKEKAIINIGNGRLVVIDSQCGYIK